MKIHFRFNLSLVLGFVLLCTSCWPSGMAAEKKIVMSALFVRETEPLGQYLYLIYQEAFRRLGYELVYLALPARRSGAEADSGKVAGELSRGRDYGETHPNLVRVEEPAISSVYSAYSLNPDLQLSGWQSLGDRTLRIEYRMGMQVPQSRLEAMAPNPAATCVASSLQGMRKLVAGRMDVYIDLEDVIEPTLQTDEFSGQHRIKKAGVMERFQAHAYLHRSYAALQGPLSETLRQMKKEGLMETYRIQAFGAENNEISARNEVPISQLTRQSARQTYPITPRP